MRKSRLYRIKGRVQGVGYRFFAERAALDLSLRGYVRNLSDGSVEVCATGNDASLNDLRSQLERGPLAARVDQIEEQEVPLKQFRTFSIEV